MSRVKYSFYIEDGQRLALRAIKERDGVLESEQIRRALDDWFVKKGLPLTKEAPKGERKRVAARRRS